MSQNASLGIDIGGTKTLCLLVNAKFDIIAETKFNGRVYGEPHGTLIGSVEYEAIIFRGNTVVRIAPAGTISTGNDRRRLPSESSRNDQPGTPTARTSCWAERSQALPPARAISCARRRFMPTAYECASESNLRERLAGGGLGMCGIWHGLSKLIQRSIGRCSTLG